MCDIISAAIFARKKSVFLKLPGDDKNLNGNIQRLLRIFHSVNLSHASSGFSTVNSIGTVSLQCWTGGGLSQYRYGIYRQYPVSGFRYHY